MKRALIRTNTYRDSFNLMQLAARIRKLPGISDVAIFMGTPANRKRMQAAGFASQVLDQAGPNDLCLGIDSDSPESADAAEREIDRFLKGDPAAGRPQSASRAAPPRSLEGAVRMQPEARLVSISLPGEYAAAEARKALERGLHVFLFSNNVPLEDEQQLKALARSKGRLLMGPDCGTALIGGQPLGFCNVLQPGPVGLVAASGTGAQEVTCLLDRQGVGTRHILGTGGRDLSSEVGGLTAQMALWALNADPDIEVIGLISKPASPEVEDALRQMCADLSKPVVACFIGRAPRAEAPSNWQEAAHLEHAAGLIAAHVQRQPPPAPLGWDEFRRRFASQIQALRGQLSPGQRYVRGLYSGGSLADEAAGLLAEVLPGVRAGAGFGPVLPIEDWDHSAGHVVLDLGEDRFTQGRPHPMLDIQTRIERLRVEARDPQAAVVLLDVVLGTNTHPNPAEGFGPEIQAAKAAARQAGRELVVIVHVCGSERDPQGTAEQRALFEGAGSVVLGSNVEAAMLAGCLAAEPAA